MKSPGIPVYAMSPKEIAALYRVTTKTFRSWLKRKKVPLPVRAGLYYTPLEVKLIYRFLGSPKDEWGLGDEQ